MLVRRNTYFITLQPILPSNAHIRTQLFRSRIFNSIAISLFWALKSKYHFYGISILNSRYNYRFEDRLLCNRIVKQEILGLMTGLCQSYVTLNTRTTSVEFLNSQFTVQFQLLQIVGSICKQSDCETRNNGAYDWLMSHPRTTEKKAEYSILTKNLTFESILYFWRLLIINTFCWWWLQSTVRWWRWRLVYHTKLGTEKDEKKNSAYKAASFLDMTAIYGRLRFKTQNNIDAVWEHDHLKVFP